MEMGDGDAMGGWVAALSHHRGRMLFTHQSLFADMPVAFMALIHPLADETLIVCK